MKRGICAIGLFVVIQVVVQILFKYGSLGQNNWLMIYILANVLSITSTHFAMVGYKYLNPNMALGVAVSSLYILSQVFLSVLFDSDLSFFKWMLLIVMAISMLLFIRAGNSEVNKY